MAIQNVHILLVEFLSAQHLEHTYYINGLEEDLELLEADGAPLSNIGPVRAELSKATKVQTAMIDEMERLYDRLQADGWERLSGKWLKVRGV